MNARGRLRQMGVLIACLAVGCSQQAKTESVSVKGDGPLIQSPDDLQPWASPGETAQLVYGGTKVPVELKLDREAQNVTIRLYAHDEQLDVESYRAGPEVFALTNAAGERYDPAIELLRFPLHVGDGWDWKGAMTTGGLPKQATAKVTTTKDRLFPDTVPLETVKVTVNLAIDANGPNGPTSKRDLIFWFAPGKGVVRREFGAASVREPSQE